MSDRMTMDESIDVYNPKNEYYYDSKDNYEPGMLQEYIEEFNCGEYRKFYTTADIMGELNSGVPAGIWYKIDEIPETFISSFGALWSVGPRGFWIPRKIYCGRENHPYWVVYAKDESGRTRMFYLHRLLAKYFIPNPHNCPLVRHLNDDGLDISLSNLAWGTQKDNMQDCIRNGHFRKFTKEDIMHAVESRMTPIVSTNLETGEERWFPSQQEASRQLGVDQSMISACVTGRTKGKYLRTRKYSFREAEK